MTTNAVFFVATSVIIYSVRTATKKIVSDSFCSDTKRYINRFCDLRVNIKMLNNKQLSIHRFTQISSILETVHFDGHCMDNGTNFMVLGRL